MQKFKVKCRALEQSIAKHALVVGVASAGLLAVVAGMNATVSALTDVETGVNGTNGADATVGGTPGGNGSAGGSASADAGTAVSNTDLSNFATATGGAGGNGGNAT